MWLGRTPAHRPGYVPAAWELHGEKGPARSAGTPPLSIFSFLSASVPQIRRGASKTIMLCRRGCSDARLAAIYGRGPRRRGPPVDQTRLAQLLDMGFPQAQVRSLHPYALISTDLRLPLALGGQAVA